LERKGDIIIRVTITRGATIKVSISGIDRCTRRMNKTGEEFCPKDLKIRTLAGR
jgi:hypothetical protein